MVGMFCALDFVLFYVFFEGVLIPMFLIIGVWGGARRVYAAFKFFLYTLLGSVLMLLAILLSLVRGRHHRHPDADGARRSRRAVQTWLWLRLLRLLRGQDADVAGPHLAARRARRGADRGLGHPGRRAAEDGRLRLPALLAADVPGGLGVLRAADLRAVDRRGRLHLAGRAGAGGHEEADRLFLGRAHGLRHARHLRLQRSRASRARSSRC